MVENKVVIIGGSGIHDSPAFEGLEWKVFDTEFRHGHGGDEQGCAPQQGKGDTPKALPHVGPVDFGGAVNVSWNSLQRAAADQHEVWIAQPQIN